MTIDVARARRETPGVEEVVHFNNAGSALMPAAVVEATIGHIRLEARIGGYEAADRAAPTLERGYAAVAELLNCRPDEIAMVESATRAWDMAFYALPFAAGDRILTGEAEYASNYIAFLQVASRTGAVVDVVPSGPDGAISVDALRDAVDDRVKLIALTHVPTNGGLVNPAAAVGKVARDAGIPYLLDACQSAGHMPLDVEEIGCDMLSLTGRKYLRGPRGTGALYVREALLDKLEPPFIDLFAATWTGPDSYVLRDDAKRFEAFESSIAGRIGFAVAVDYALGWGLPAIRDRVYALADLMRARLASCPGLSVHDIGSETCGIVSFSVADVPAVDVEAALRAQSINTSISTRPSTRLDMERRGLEAIGRASVHYYNTEDEVERLVAAVRDLPVTKSAQPS